MNWRTVRSSFALISSSHKCKGQAKATRPAEFDVRKPNAFNFPVDSTRSCKELLYDHLGDHWMIDWTLTVSAVLFWHICLHDSSYYCHMPLWTSHQFRNHFWPHLFKLNSSSYIKCIGTTSKKLAPRDFHRKNLGTQKLTIHVSAFSRHLKGWL